MLSNNKKKFITGLKLKKNRVKSKSFIVEGEKLVDELLKSDFEVNEVFCTQNWSKNKVSDATVISEQELKSISQLKTPNNVLAIVKQPKQQLVNINQSISLVLDNIKDPGNLGTIIRIADWFGIENIVCSNLTVDVYNSKVAQATMGSIFNVNIVYTNIVDFLTSNKSLMIYGAVLNGNSVYKTKLIDKGGIVVIGSESHGISKEVLPLLKQKITIPSFGKAESLNAAVATSIICSELKRNA